MESNPEGQSFLSWLIAAAGAAIMGIGTWIWVNTMGRISSLESNKIGRMEFDGFKTLMETARQEQRKSTHDLRDSVEGMVTTLHAKIDANQRELISLLIKK